MATIPVFGKHGNIVAYTIVDEGDYVLLAKHKWRIRKSQKTSYAYTTARSGPDVGMHRFILGLVPGDGKVVDHINRDGLDNRRENLRICTVQENLENSVYEKRKWGPEFFDPSNGINVGDPVSINDLKLAHIAAVIDKCATLQVAAKILGVEASTLWRWRAKLFSIRA